MSNISVINKMATLGSVAKTAAPKVGRTLGTLNSKKVALGTTASVGQNLTDRIQNAQGKIQELGGDVPKPKTTALGWLLENLPRTGYGATNMIRELLQPDEGLTPGEFDPLAAWMRGFKKVEQPLGKDIMTGFGLEGDKAMLTGGDPHIYNPSAAGLAGLLLDIFNPTDPLNWIGFGTGSAVKSGGLRGAKALEKSFGSQSAQRIASLLGDEAVSGIGARSVGRIIKQVTEGGKKIGLDETGMKNLTDYLRQGMSEAGTNPKTKVNYWQGKPITVGLQNPLTLGLKGNFAEFAVPGSEHLTGAISKGINKFKQTRVGDTLGEMFEVGHVSKDAPQKLFVRSTTKDLDELVKRHRQGKIKLPATAKEIAAMKEDLNKISLVNVYDTNTATGGINFDLLAGIVGVDSGTLMELFDQRLPFTHNIGELFKVFKKADVEDAVAFRQSVMLRGVMDKLIDIIPNEYRSLFKGTVMTPGIGVEYFKGTLADNVGNIRNAASPYINYIFERDGVGIAIPVNVGENFNEAVWKKLDTAVAAIDELPAEVRKKIVQDIQIAPHNLGEYVDEKTGIKTIDPQGMTLHGQITLADPDIMMDTLKHESGHIVWQNNPELADRYVQAAQQEISQGKSIGVTDYGYAHIANTAGKASERESFKEDFAEAIYRALTDPELFVQEHPVRAKVIQEAIYDGSITPDELVAIKEVAEARADKIAKSYGAEKQLDSVLNGVDDAVEDVMMNGSEDMIDAQIATKQFTRDITRVFEKSLSTGEDFRLAIKQIWKNVSPEESREILRIASEFDSSSMRGMRGPSFYSAINDRLNPTYYSRLKQVVDEKMSNSMPVKDLKNMLKSNGVKDEEIKWTFLDEFFDAKGGKVTKEEVQQWLDWNNLEIQEIMKIGDQGQKAITNRLDELGTTLDDVSVFIEEELFEEFDISDPRIYDSLAERYGITVDEARTLERMAIDPEYFTESNIGNETAWGQHTEPGGGDYRELIFTLPYDYDIPKIDSEVDPNRVSKGPAYTKPGHWRDVDNPVAHARFDTRYTTEGKKILFIEEIQSDWHQEGWTRGYKDKETTTKYEEMYKELEAMYQEIPDLASEFNEMVSDAPFRNTWRELVLKRLSKYASEEGFDGISWTSGAQQNKRWFQTSNVDLITYSPETKSLTSYYKYKDGYNIEKRVTIEKDKDLKKYLTNEQIAKLTDTTPLELKVEPVKGWGSNMGPDDLNIMRMGAVEQKGLYYDKFGIVDQYGNKFPYIYDDEASALKAIEDYYIAGQGQRSLSQGDLQWGGGGFRLSYDERIPQDMEKLTKRFKLKTEDLNLGTISHNISEFLMNSIEAGEDDFAWEALSYLTIAEELSDVTDDIVANCLAAVKRDSIGPSEVDGFIDAIGFSFDNWVVDDIPDYHNGFIPTKEDFIASLTKSIEPKVKESAESMIQKGVMFSDEAKDFFRENAFPLFKKTNNIDPDIQNVDEAISHLSEEAQNAFREFIKWRESIVKEYQKRDIPINVLEKYVPFVFTRKGTADEMLALNALFGTGSMPEADNLSSLINWLSGYDPNLKPRTTQATNPLEVNKVLKKPILSEDGAVIMATRGTRAIQATELYDFAEEFMGQYGRTVDEMAEYGNIKGYSLYKPKTTPDGRRVFEKVTSADKIIDNDPSVMFLPEELVKIYNDYTDMIFGKQGMNRLLKTYDKATSLYKKLAYLWNPGHIMRDFTGNVFNGYLMGLTNPKYYKEAFDYMMSPDMMVKVPGFTDMTAKQFMSKCRQNGVLDIGSSLAEFAGDPVIGMKKGKNPAMKALNGYGWAMRMGTRQSDTFTRLAGMLYQLRQGRSFDEAAVQVKKFYFDYFELTSFERNVMKRIIPFYTWMRKNIPLQLEMMIKNPRELARISDAMNAAAGEPINWSEQPEYIQEAGAFPLGNLNHYLSPNLPYSDLSRGIPNLETAKNWLSAVNPIIRAPIELATNTQWFNGRPIENYGGEQRDLPLAGLLRSLGIETPTVSKRGAGYLADQIPLLRNLDAVTNPDNPRQMEKASTFLGGPGLYKKDAVQTSSQYEYLKLLQDLIRLLQEQNQNIVE